MNNTSKYIDCLTIVTSDGGGGAEQTQLNFISQLIKEEKNCYSIIITKKKDGRWEKHEEKSNVIYFPFKSHFLGYLYLIPYLTYLFVSKNISYTFTSQTLINGMLGLLKKIIRKTKVIVRESNSIFELLKGYKLFMYKLAYNIGYSKVDLVICQTEYMKKKLLLGVPWLENKTKVCVVSNPINEDDIDKKSKEEMPKLYGEKYIVGAGRLVDAKGFDILIDTYSEIKNKIDNCKLYILGEGEDREKLTKQIKKLNLQNDIILKGMVPNVYPYFKNANLCVMSSRIEGFPNVLLQMMSQNEKVVTTLSAGDIDKIPNIYTCPTNHKKRLGDAIIKCYQSNTSSNRNIYDNFLEKRKLSVFVKTILDNVQA